jgi:DNA-binding protein YbaB
MDTQRWLTSYQQRTEELGATVELARRTLAEVEGTAVSSGGGVTVTASATGALRRLVFGAAADDLTRSQLAELVLRTAAQAHRQAARAAIEVMKPVLGEDSAGLRFLRARLFEPADNLATGRAWTSGVR